VGKIGQSTGNMNINLQQHQQCGAKKYTVQNWNKSTRLQNQKPRVVVGGSGGEWEIGATSRGGKYFKTGDIKDQQEGTNRRG